MADFNYRKLPAEGARPRDVASAVNLLIDGKHNAKGTFTLTPHTTTTTVEDYRVGEDSVISWTPLTHNAAVEMNIMYVSSRGKHTFTLVHQNKSATDATFAYTVTS
jgi:hypothetical protein